MLTTTKHFILFNLIALAAITCSYVGFHPQPKPTLTAVSTTAPAPSDGLLVRKGDAFVGGTNAETAKAIIHSAFLGPAHPAEYAFLLVDQQHGGHMVIAISPDGTVKFGDGVTPNEAALQFAEAMKTVMAQRSDCAAPLPEQR